jgi:lipoyl(octanoyl) transferase
MSGFFAFRKGYSYEQALRLQGLLNGEGRTGLLAFECQPTITVGIEGDLDRDVLVGPEYLQSHGYSILSTDRDGAAAYHGPGQLVGFPLASIKESTSSAEEFRRFSEELLLGLAHAVAVLGVRDVSTRTGQLGLWTNRGLLANLAVTKSEGRVYHGFSLHVSAESLEGFRLVEPWGISGCPLTSLEQEGVKVGSMEELAMALLPYLTVLHSAAEAGDPSKAVSYESTYAHLVTAVSRSPMAVEHLRSNLETIRNVE